MAGIQCPLCDQGFGAQSEYVAHLAQAHGLEDEPGTDSLTPPDDPAAVYESPPPRPPIGDRTPPSFAWHAGAPAETPPAAAPPPPVAQLPASPPPFVPPPFVPPGALPPPPPTTPPAGPSPSGPPFSYTPFGGPPAPPAPLGPGARPDPQVSRTVVAVVAVALVVAIIGVAVYVASSRQSSNEATGNTVSQSGDLTTTASTLPVLPPVTGQSTDPSISLDTSEASEVANALWTHHVKAMSARDLRALSVYESGAALDADQGYACYCGPEPLYAAQNVFVVVPRQTGWPVSFLATVTYTSFCTTALTPCADTFVAVQRSRGAPWTIAVFVQFSGTAKAEEPAEGYGAYTAPPPPLTTGNASALPDELALYLTAEKTTGKPPGTTRIADNAFTRDMSQIYVPPGANEAKGFTSVGSYFADAARDPVYAFATSGFTTTVCGTVRYHHVDTALPGHVITQPADRSVEGPGLPPGTYSSVVEDGLHMACLEFATDEPLNVLVIGTYGETASIAGVPA